MGKAKSRFSFRVAWLLILAMGLSLLSAWAAPAGRAARAQGLQLDLPVRELKAFRRVSLKPGESRAVDLRIAVSELWFIGLDMKPVVEPGTFRVYVGPNSAEGQEATFECTP